ncbi:MAG: LysM peptidoglycan-binding domain-containing protein [Bdellovibrionales bacterium]|nr:LysM peptidoglycan-binding domain-containing protein [Bdellovibrionales bacterium]
MAISKNKYLFLMLLVGLGSVPLHAQEPDLEEVNVFESLNSLPETSSTPGATNPTDVKMSTVEEQDDLLSLKEDVGEVIFNEKSPTANTAKPTGTSEAANSATKLPDNLGGVQTSKGPLNVVNPKGQTADVSKYEKTEIIADETVNFDVGSEEKKLVELSKYVQAKITPKEWDDLAIKAKLEKYDVQKGDYLWKISKQLFGSGFYYSKIWSLNPQITNPHEIEPGTVLAFDTGDADTFPKVQVGAFADDEIQGARAGGTYSNVNDLNRPGWMDERKKLIDQGVYFQFASEETYDDLERLERQQRNLEYEKYDPPLTEISIKEPSEVYDSNGFDKSNKIVFNYREGFFLNTFVTTNVVQDLGFIKATARESVFINKFDTIYVNFDKSAQVKPGDLFSVYTTGGEVKHKVSDRSGFQYSTTAQIKAVRKIDDVWECLITDQSGLVQRKDRISFYTPKISKISKTFSRRSIEAAIIGGYRDSLTGMSYGDVVYIDRGRADGVELGNVFDVYSFLDRGTLRKITPSPTYKIGELTVINITDNFSTVLITGSKDEIALGSIAVTRTQEEQTRSLRLKNKEKLGEVKKVEGKALDELDVELNLDDVSQDILNKADKIQLTEDELEELERQERDKSVIKDSDKDVKELDRLESELKDAESSLNERKVDEDKFLEQQSLEDLEKKSKQQDPNAFESLNEIEQDIGRKYLDEDINNKENPYGLTEFDLEEVDELLNTDSKK